MKIQDLGNALQVTIERDEYRVLQRVASAMNSTSWSDGDNTPETLARDWLLELVENELHNPAELAADILDGIATDDEGLTEAPEPLHSQRLAELRLAFESAGVMG